MALSKDLTTKKKILPRYSAPEGIRPTGSPRPQPDGSVHTPGPWEASERAVGDDTIHVFAANPKGCAADGDLVTIADFVETDANANLIAAAPDLLAALRASVDLVEDYLQGRPEIAEQMRTAIARAEGR